MQIHYMFNGSNWVQNPKPVFTAHNLQDVFERNVQYSDSAITPTEKEKMQDLLDTGMCHPALSNPVGVHIIHSLVTVELKSIINPPPFTQKTLASLMQDMQSLLDKHDLLLKRTPSIAKKDRSMLENSFLKVFRAMNKSESEMHKLVPKGKDVENIPFAKFWTGGIVLKHKPEYELSLALTDLEKRIKDYTPLLESLAGKYLNNPREGGTIVGAKLAGSDLQLMDVPEIKDTNKAFDNFVNEDCKKLLLDVSGFFESQPMLRAADMANLQRLNHELFELILVVEDILTNSTKINDNAIKASMQQPPLIQKEREMTCMSQLSNLIKI